MTREPFGSGGRWVEPDQPAIVALKDAELPADQAPNPLQRVAIDFASEALADKLAPWAGKRPSVVVLEGVATYLKRAELRATLDTLTRVFPGHVLICDLMTAQFVRRYGGAIKRKVEELGARYGEMSDDPTRLVTEKGYRLVTRVSIVDRSRELGAVAIPRATLNTLLRGLRDGYCAYVFQAIR